MESISTQDDHADLERVFGPLDPASSASLRTALANVDGALTQLIDAARRMRQSSWRVVPTRLDSLASGQNAITAYVEDGNADEGVTFWFELHASNYYDRPSDRPRSPWQIDVEVSVDGPEGRNESVFRRTTQADSPVAAIQALNEAVMDILRDLPEKPPNATVWRGSQSTN
jgi:hypothetical protein